MCHIKCSRSARQSNNTCGCWKFGRDVLSQKMRLYMANIVLNRSIKLHAIDQTSQIAKYCVTTVLQSISFRTRCKCIRHQTSQVKSSFSMGIVPKKKIILRQRYLRYLQNTNCCVFTILSAME